MITISSANTNIIDGSGKNYDGVSLGKGEGNAQESGSQFSLFLGKSFDTGSCSGDLMVVHRDRSVDDGGNAQESGSRSSLFPGKSFDTGSCSGDLMVVHRDRSVDDEGNAQESGSRSSLFPGKSFDTGSCSGDLMVVHRDCSADDEGYFEQKALFHNIYRNIDEVKINSASISKSVKLHLSLYKEKIEHDDSNIHEKDKPDQKGIFQFLSNNNIVYYNIENTYITSNIKFVQDKHDDERRYNVDDSYRNHMFNNEYKDIQIIFDNTFDINQHKDIKHINIERDLDKNFHNMVTEVSDKGNKVFSMTVMTEEEHPVHIKIEGIKGVTNTIILQSESHDIAHHLMKNRHDLISTLESAGIDTRHIRIEILEPSAVGDKEDQRDGQNHDNLLNNGGFFEQRQQREGRDSGDFQVNPSTMSSGWEVEDTERDLAVYASMRRKGLNITA